MPEETYHEGLAMRVSCERFTIRRMMVMVAALAIALGLFVYCLRWIQYPHINVTIFNETSTPIYDLSVSFLNGERTAKSLSAGGVAFTEIQSGGDAGVFFSYRDSEAVLRRAKPIYYESGNRGFLEVRVTDGGTRLVNGIYAGIEFGVFSIPVPPTGRLTVK
jgi:hypothetical protein